MAVEASARGGSVMTYRRLLSWRAGMVGKPVTYWQFFSYPQTLWIRLWNTGVQASPRLAGPARRTGWRFFRQLDFCFCYQRHDRQIRVKPGWISAPRDRGGSDFAAVHNERRNPAGTVLGTR